MMSDYMGKVSAEAFENLARASIAQDETIRQLRAELAAITAERDALRVRVATAERDRFDLIAERDALRAKLDAGYNAFLYLDAALKRTTFLRVEVKDLANKVRGALESD